MTEEVYSNFWIYAGIQPSQKGYWKKNNKLIFENILTWVKWFEKRHRFLSKEDWYNVSGKMIEENYGSGFFTAKAENSVRQSVCDLMNFIYPDYDWKPSKFIQAPQGYWKSRDNRLEWFNNFRKENSLNNDSDLYKLKSEYFEKYKGCLSYYKDSIHKLLKDLVPDKQWYEWRSDGQVPKNFWKNRDNIISWFKIEICPKYDIENDGLINYKNMYKLTQPIINDNYGRGLFINYFNGSINQLLTYIYPEFNWQFWKFVSAPNRAWNNDDNIKKYLKEEHKIEKEEDFYNFNISDMPTSITDRYDTILELAKSIYPNYNWDIKKFSNHLYSKAAIRFLNKISSLINHNICHAENGGEYKIPGTRYKADGYIMILNLIIEYHGCYYHGCINCYKDTHNTICKKNNRTHLQNYEKTLKRTDELRNKGYKVIEIWECEALSSDDDYIISLFREI